MINVNVGTDSGPGENCLSAAPVSDCGGAAPPLEIVVDYGDGSGGASWRQDSMVDVFTHIYTVPGTYGISVKSENP